MGEKYSALEKTYSVFLIGGILYPFWMLFSMRGDVAEIGRIIAIPQVWTMVLVGGIFPSVVAYTLNNYAAARLPVVIFASFSSLITVTAFFTGILVLKNPVSPAAVIGSALVVYGAYKVVRPQGSKEKNGGIMMSDWRKGGTRENEREDLPGKTRPDGKE